jgi:flagellar hook-basal body complex protein FliE
MIDPLSSVGAASGLTVASPSPASAAAPSAGASFSDALGQAASNAVDSLKGGEAAAIQGIEGSMTPYKVVEAVMGAQRTLQAALAIRDKAVSAYQEVSRMAI